MQGKPTLGYFTNGNLTLGKLKFIQGMPLRGFTNDFGLTDLLASICNLLLPFMLNANRVETETTSQIC